MKWMKDKFMNNTIQRKLIFSFLLIAFISFCMFGVLAAGLFLRQGEKTVSGYTKQMIHQVDHSIDVYIRSIEKVSDYLMVTLEKMDFAGMKSEEDPCWREESSRLLEMLNGIAQTHQEVAGILIATENDMYVSKGMTRISRDSFQDETWYIQAKEDPDKIQIISNTAGRNIVTNESYSIDDVFSIAKAIVNRSSKEVEGVLLIDIMHNVISESIENIALGENGYVFVMDEKEHIVYTPVTAITYRVNPAWLRNYQKPVTAEISGQRYQIQSEQSEYTGWKIVGVFSINDIMGSVYNMLYFLYGGLVLLLLVILVVSIMISRTITNPVIELKKLMKKAETGDFTVRFQGTYEDEVSELGRTFNHMLEKIEELVHMVYVEQKNKRVAELKVLQEQIKPHFLYNTLDTISWMAREYHAPEIVQLVEALTNVFRIGLSKGKDYISVEQEIKYVTNYLYIQKIRYGEKLNYRIDKSDDLLQCEIPKLILQPLVENAIYHGIKTKSGNGMILIRVLRLSSSRMELSVEDDGSGMNQEKVDELNRMLNRRSQLSAKQSFGLFYVKERLRIRYGEHFSVKVSSQEHVGTKVVICIPMEGENGEGGAADE